MIKFNFFGLTDVGLRRSRNEDSFALDPVGLFLAVADGMGGAAAGDVASRIFIDAARELLTSPSTGDEALRRVKEAFRLANERILAYAGEDPARSGMGCTAELAAFHDGGFVVGHVGDSRTYLFRRGELMRVTRDHSLVQEQVDRGILTPGEARTSRMRNIILRSVGGGADLTVDIIRGEVLPGDVFLLCSDGLHGKVDDWAMAEVVASGDALSGKVRRLVELAKFGGGDDNITVAVCEAEVR